MKKLIMLAAALASSFCCIAQNIVKVYDNEYKDSIFYQLQTAVLIIDKQDVEDYFKGLDTILPQRKYSKEVFRNIQFSHLQPEEVQRHYGLASRFWAASKNNPLSYTTDKIALFWNDNETILLPYLDEILPELLEGGRVQIVDRATGKRIKQFQVDYEDVGLKTFKIFRFVKGKFFWRESEVFVEQMSTVGR
ncbi:hypothetical protein EGT74_01750 [Chitinophaga lutea]|uniref:Uncharacterized protein n=1 Tax=Chitinophaga lutea TaxID=2488634 RepID=A0A3N4PWF6_9BACT|nr:hypothetical protein [Chitinophaga lutea]RPE12306.1 hypothetical protein EGT74_01750 [Chitinophaga lutea]